MTLATYGKSRRRIGLLAFLAIFAIFGAIMFGISTGGGQFAYADDDDDDCEVVDGTVTTEDDDDDEDDDDCDDGGGAGTADDDGDDDDGDDDDCDATPINGTVTAEDDDDGDDDDCGTVGPVTTPTLAPATTGTLNVQKIVNNNGNSSFTSVAADFDLVVTTDGGLSIPGGTFDGSANTALSVQAGQTFTVKEMDSKGYTVSFSGACAANLTGGADVFVAVGGNVTCTVTNTAPAPGPQATGSINVRLEAGGDDQTFFDYTFSPPLTSFMLQDWDSDINFGDDTTFGSLAAGVYVITQADEPGYSLDDITCTLQGGGAANAVVSEAAGTATVTLAAGQNVSCVFTNSLEAGPAGTNTVTVVKYIGGSLATSGSFDLTSTWTAANLNGGVQASGNFSLNAGNSFQAVTSAMNSGFDYSVVENNIDATCGVGDTYRLAGYSIGATLQAAASAAVMASVSIDNGTSNQFIIVHNVPCDVTAGTSTVTIVKDAGNAAGSSVHFTTNLAGWAAGFNLDDDAATAGLMGSWTVVGLSGVTFNVSEDAAAGWTLESVSCTEEGDASLTGIATVNPDDSVSFNIGANAGLDITCTFVNVEDEDLSSSVTIIKDAGDRASTDVHFSTDGLAPHGDFDAILDVDGHFMLDDDTNATLGSHVMFEGLGAAQFSITEEGADGWMLDSITCQAAGNASLVGIVDIDESSGTIDFDIDADADLHITCTFVNVLEVGTTPTVTATGTATVPAAGTPTSTATAPATSTPTSSATAPATGTATVPGATATPTTSVPVTNTVDTAGPSGGDTAGGGDSAVAGARPDVLAPSTGNGTSTTERNTAMAMVIAGLLAMTAGATVFSLRRQR